jgi:hypothetical protein
MRRLPTFVFLIAAAASVAATPLAAWDMGSRAELVARPNPDGYALPYVPALVSVLAAAEEQKGGPLSEAEVLSLCERAIVLAVPAVMARTLEEGRGYRDLDPARCWDEWQQQRHRFIKLQRSPDARL